MSIDVEMDCQRDRYTIETVARSGPQESFAEHVRRNFAGRPKRLSQKFLYDEIGSILFEAICLVPEYYVTRAEQAILAENVGEIINVCALPKSARVIDLGSGGSRKTELFLERLARRGGVVDYVPIDIAGSALEAASRRLVSRFTGLNVAAMQGEYSDVLAAFRGRGLPKANLALFLGSSIGNLEPELATTVLSLLRDCMAPDACLILGADLLKSPDVLVAAYDDSLGVTAAFNLNMLGRINRELGGAFDLRRFRHVALFNADAARTEMYIESTVSDEVRIASLGIDVSFSVGERIHTENSYKYTVDSVARIGLTCGFRLERTWTDGKGQFACNVLRVC